MNYLKTKLSFNLLFLTFLIIIYAIMITKFGPTSCYDGSETEIIGMVQAIKYVDEKVIITVKAKEKVLGYYYLKNKENIELKLGIKVKLKGNLEIPTVNTNQNLFNYRNYLLSQKIKWLFIIDDISVVSNQVSLFYQVKNKIDQQIDKATLSKEYLKTFILGENIISEDIKESYQENGISHLLAISGMHITLLTTMILTILNKIMEPKISYLITSVIIFGYAFLTGLEPPVIRAVSLFFLLTVNRFLNLKIKPLDYLMVLVMVLLINNPYYIYDLGFKFSFIVSFYIILFSNLISNKKGYFNRIFMLSLIAFITGFPILINNFFKVNLLTPLINIIFVPLVSLIVFPLILITFVFPCFDLILFKVITLMEQLSLLINQIDFLIVIFPKIPTIIMVVYYFVITICLVKNKLKYWLILLLVFVIHYCLPYFNYSYEIHMLDVGQGDSILIKWPQNKLNILIDTGGNINKKETYLAKKTLIPYFYSLGIKKIDYLILTHGDYDHMGEAKNLVNNFKIEKVIFNCGDFNELEQELIKVLDKNKIPYYSCVKELNIDNNKLYFLNNKDYGNENDDSSVIYTELNNHKFLFMGDAGVEVEEDILEKYNLYDIDVLKIGHHGSKTSSSREFINEVNPKYSIISVGKNNRYGHPNKEVLDTLANSKTYRTDQDGSIMFKIKNDKLKIETCTP